jgi:hypothetical protein
MKMLLKLVGVLVLLLIVVGIVGYIWIDSIAKAAIEKGGTYALGVETTVSDVSLSPVGGTMKIDGLAVANPEGFKDPHLMTSGRFDLAVVTGSLLKDTIQVSKFELDGLNLNIEQTLQKNNVSAILNSLKKFESAEKPKKKDEGAGKKVKVDVITIRNVQASFRLPVGSPLTVKVPEIQLKDVTGDNAEGVVVGELIARVLPAVLAAVLEKSKGVVPDGLLNTLNGDLGGLAAAAGGQLQQLVGNARGDIRKAVGDAVGKAAGDATKNIGKTVGGALDGLLGGKKKPEKKDD